MGIICIDESVWETLIKKIERLSAISLQTTKNDNELTDTTWIDSDEACRILHISKRTLQYYRDNAVLPFSNMGGKFYYSMEDIEQFMQSRTKNKH